MKIPRRALLALAFLLLLPSTLLALPAHRFTQYTSEDGLDEYIVQCIVQDHRGLMWFATWNGLYSFDGFKFQQCQAGANGVVPTNSRLDQLDEDTNGLLWMVAYDGIVFTYDPHEEQFEQITTDAYQVSTLRLMPDGIVWLQTQQHELLVAHRDSLTGKIEVDDFFADHGLSKPSRINQLTIDRQGRHWILTEEGAYRYNPTNGDVTIVSHLSCYEMVELDGTYYVGSRNGLLLASTDDNREAKGIQLDTHSSIKRLNLHPSGGMVACTASDGFFIFTPLNDGETQLTANALVAGFSSRHVTASNCPALGGGTLHDIFIDHFGDLWLRTAGTGVVHYEPQSGRARRFILYDMYGQAIVDSRGDQMAVEDAAGQLWIHPSGGGLAWYNRERDELEPFFNPNLQNRWSNANKLTALFSDRQGNLWFGSYGNGLEKASFGLYPFAIESYDQRALDFAGNNIRAVLQDSNGYIWAGGKDRVIRVYDEQYHFVGNLCHDGSVRSDKVEALGLAYGMMQSRDGTLWIGTKGDGLFMLTPSTQSAHYQLRQFTASDDNVYSLSSNEIYSLYEDQRGRIWIATFQNGINIMERDDKGTPERFYSTRNQLTSYPLITCYRSRFVTGDHQGNIWIGTTNGLLSCTENFMSPNKLTFRRYHHDKDDPTSLNCDDVHGIYFTSDNRAFVCTFGGGISEMTHRPLGDATGVTFRRIGSREQSEMADVLLSMLQDSIGNLWCAAEDGLCRYNLTDGSVTNFRARLFPLRFTINEGRALELRNGELLFNTTRGLLHFDPRSIHAGTFAPPIHFTTDSILLRPGQHSFVTQFAALDYVSPEVITYAYRLKGFEQNWTYVGTGHTATYTNLRPGKYELEVRSTNSGGFWVDNTACLAVEVMPTFSETPWAALLRGLAALALLAIIIHIAIVIYRLKHQVKVEEQLTNMKLKFFTNVSHELRTPLTLITGPLEHIMQRSDLTPELSEQLGIVSNNASKMSHLVSQILDFRKIQNGKMTLTVEHFDLVALARRATDDFKLLAETMQIDLIFEPHVAQLPIWADQDKLAQVISNLLSNAFKYSHTGHPIRVTIDETKGRAMISVRDYGVGITREKLQTLYERFGSRVRRTPSGMESTGIGLSLTKELVNLHHGQITVHSQPNLGTCFTVYIPKGRDHFAPDTEFIVSDGLPEATAADRTPNVIGATPEATQSETDTEQRTSLLIVEDNDELRHFIHQIFASSYQVYEAPDGEAGLEQVRQLMPDIVISDVMMPGMDGFSLAEQMRNDPDLCHIPLILLTALADTDNKLQGLRTGIDDYITKPFSASYLQARIENIVQKRRLLQQYYMRRLTSAIVPTFTAHDAADDVVSRAEAIEPMLSPADQHFIDTVIQDLQLNISNADYTVDDMAHATHMSRSSYAKKLRALIGQAPSDLLRDTRMKRAAELIDAGQLTIAQVAYEVGFNDPHYFGKCFKAYYQMTATEWKQRHL